MRVAVLGNGASGKAAAAVLRARGDDVMVLDGEATFPTDVALAVTSPGIALDHPWQQAARAAGVPVISELQLGVENFRARGGRLVAVTGSKGKSSVVKLCAAALNGTPCGNYGTPVSALTPRFKGDWAVVEVSSFQMETTNLANDAFEAALILNLQEDHLDRHGSVTVYHNLKRKLLGMAKIGLDGSREEPLSADSARRVAAERLLAGSYFDNGVLRSNGCLAVALLRAVGVDDDIVRSTFTSFEPLPHRFQKVAEIKGVTWIDDSKATSIAALAAGIEMAGNGGSDKNVRLIAGGLKKGDSTIFAFYPLRKWVKMVYIIGCDMNWLYDAWRSEVPCFKAGTMAVAVREAMHDARAGETVLLSPGAASFDQFKNFSDRGEVFAELVKQETRT